MKKKKCTPSLHWAIPKKIQTGKAEHMEFPGVSKK